MSPGVQALCASRKPLEGPPKVLALRPQLAVKKGRKGVCSAALSNHDTVAGWKLTVVARWTS